MRGKTRELGHVPFVTAKGGVMIPCPNCGRQVFVPTGELGKETRHGKNSTCSGDKKCQQRFVLDSNLRGYVFRDQRIGTVEWEQQ